MCHPVVIFVDDMMHVGFLSITKYIKLEIKMLAYYHESQKQSITWHDFYLAVLILKPEVQALRTVKGDI